MKKLFLLLRPLKNSWRRRLAAVRLVIFPWFCPAARATRASLPPFFSGLLLLIGSFGLVARGQTNSPSPDASERDVGLTADHFFFSGIASRQLIYSGNVCVTNSQGSLTSERLTIDLPPEDSKDGRPTNVVAETNVVINYIKDGDTNHITCDKMINLYSVVNSVTNDTFTFTGHARMSNSKGWMTGEPLVYDNVKGQFSGTGIKSQFSVPSSMNGGTNAGTNKVTSPLNLFK